LKFPESWSSRSLQENHRIIIGESDTLTARFLGHLCQFSGCGFIGQLVHLTRLAHVPVLAKLAGEIAAGGAKRKYRSAWQEMIQGLLSDRIDTKTTRSTTNGKNSLVILAGSDKTKPLLAIPEFAKPRADLTLHPAIIQLAPVLRRLFAVIVRFRHFRPIPGSYLRQLIPSIVAADDNWFHPLLKLQYP
jgi:hypothetical protein